MTPFSIKRANREYKWNIYPYGLSFVVHGAAKRAIRVILEISPRKTYDEDVIVTEAAKMAAKRGWKNIVVTQDDYSPYEANYPLAYNPVQYRGNRKNYAGPIGYGIDFGFDFEQSLNMYYDADDKLCRRNSKVEDDEAARWMFADSYEYEYDQEPAIHD